MDEQTLLLKQQLYAACEDVCAGDADKLFTQQDLMGLEVVPKKEIGKLMKIVTLLTSERLFAPVHLHSNLAWRIRPEAEAAKYKQLTTQDQILAYEIIDAAGSEGAWQQDIKRRLNVQDNALRKALKELEAQGLVVQFTTVENTSKKMWIKKNIKPSARATGGPWYTDQFLDEAFIEALLGVVVTFIKERASYWSRGGTHRRSTSPVVPKKGVINGAASDAAVRSKKRTADTMLSNDDGAVAVPPAKARKEIRLPLPAGFTQYPTADEITDFLRTKNVTKGQPLREEHVQELINVLLWDNRIEEVKMSGERVGYRTVRISKQNPSTDVELSSEDYWESRTNGLTSVPCGRCPVFDLCEEGGPVWAGGCEYFDQWLT